MYKDTLSNVVILLEGGVSIPKDSRNSDYQSYLKWVQAGGVVEKADEVQSSSKN
jgi:hypothetical protein